MDVAKTIERTFKFLLKIYIALLILCIALQILTCWISSIRLTVGEKLELCLSLAVVSVIAYFVRKYRHPHAARTMAHHGAERTPLMPQRRGQR